MHFTSNIDQSVYRRNVYTHLTDYFILCRFSSHSVVLFEAYNPHAFLNFKLAHVIAPYMEQPHTHRAVQWQNCEHFFSFEYRNWNRNKIAGPVFFLKTKIIPHADDNVFDFMAEIELSLTHTHLNMCHTRVWNYHTCARLVGLNRDCWQPERTAVVYGDIGYYALH